jgi:hypothetical protein
MGGLRGLDAGEAQLLRLRQLQRRQNSLETEWGDRVKELADLPPQQ